MAKSFVFIGDRNTGMALAQNLVDAGYPNATGMESADIIITMCSDQSLLEDIYFEGHGVIANARPGTFVIDMSPVTPVLAKEIAAMAQVNDLHPLEAPVVVRDMMMEDAYSDPSNLIMFTAGEKNDVAEMMPLLEVLSDSIRYCGEAGEAQLAKCASTIQIGAQVASLMEAEALFRNASSKQPFSDFANLAIEQDLLPAQVASVCRAIADRDNSERAGFNIATFMGEVLAALTAAEEMGLYVPGTEAVEGLLHVLMRIGGENLPVSAMTVLYSEESEATKLGLDWKRNEGHDHHCGDDCDCGHDHSHDHDAYAYGYDEYVDDEGFGLPYMDDYDGWSSN